MSTLAEKIAAKRALAMQAAPSPAADIVDSALDMISHIVETAIKKEETAIQAEPVPTGKPLTFMEQMALKKAAKVSTSTPESVSAQPVKSLETPQQELAAIVSTHWKQTSTTKAEQAINPSVLAPIVEKFSLISVGNTEPSNVGILANIAKVQEEPDFTDVPIVDQQAYRDIKAKLDLLEDMSEVNLKDAMSDLKKSLLKNPQACYLILPQEVGQMVIALRRMKNEDVVTAEKVKKEPGAKKAKASKALTADEIATAFDEL